LIATALALRLGRWGIAGFSGLAFISSLIQAVGFYTIAGRSPAERATFAQSMSALATQFTLILPPPSRLDTVAGYVQWRSFGGLAILFAVWALASASGAARADEERGVVESLLASGVTRPGLIGSRIAAFAASSFIAALAAGLGLIAGAANGGESVSFGSVLEAALVLAALALGCYSLTLLVSQLTAARIATAASGMLLLALFLINSLSHNFSSLSLLRWLSPFRYYELNQPLASDAIDWRATLMLLLIALAGAAAAAVAFASRDLGSPLIRLPVRSHPTTYEVTSLPLWRMPIVRGLYERRVGIAVWTVGMAILGAVSVALTKSILQPLLSIPAMGTYFGSFLHGQVYTTFLGYFWFGLAQLLFAAFAITQVARWSAEDVDGRLELILANPQSRVAVVIERALVLMVSATLIAAVSGLAVGYASHNQSIDLNGTRLAAASLLLVPFALVFAAAGSVLAAWNPRGAVGLLGAFAFASYLISEVGPLFRWPESIQSLSAFKLFGTPLSSGVDRAGLLTMVAIIVVGFGASILVMQRRDTGR
jgi:ABC-2 type transport system permease protein